MPPAGLARVLEQVQGALFFRKTESVVLSDTGPCSVRTREVWTVPGVGGEAAEALRSGQSRVPWTRGRHRGRAGDGPHAQRPGSPELQTMLILRVGVSVPCCGLTDVPHTPVPVGSCCWVKTGQRHSSF